MWKCVSTNPLVSACCARHKNMEKLVLLPFAPLLVLYLIATAGKSVAVPSTAPPYMVSTVLVTETELGSFSTFATPPPSEESQTRNGSELASSPVQNDTIPESSTVEQSAQPSALPSTQPEGKSTGNPLSESTRDSLSISSLPSSKRTTASTTVSSLPVTPSQQPPTKTSSTAAVHSTGDPMVGVMSSAAKITTQSPMTATSSRQTSAGTSTGQPSTQHATRHQSTSRRATSPQVDRSATVTISAVLTSLKKTTTPSSQSTDSNGDWSILGINKNSFTGKILLPIAIGIVFSVVIIAVAYAYCSRKRKTRTGKTHGNGVHDMTSMDRVMLLADSSEDEF